MTTTSCTPFNKIFYNVTTNGTNGSETPSEISSIDSDWSDIRTIAIKLGVPNPDDLLSERFKVDRQKLENMIKVDGTIEGVNSAEQFFNNVMKSTATYISWPCRLKIGAKTKKDPHVRIVGKPEDVLRAKEQVLFNLDSRGSRVIMKMDVSYTDHSYIIGRGGNNIKQIMEETSTHIHFPDSNRSNPTEKSNQVSLCGSLEGVERARSLVRLSTPLLISFELPVMAPGRHVPSHDTPYIKEIETQYNVQVIFSTRPKLHSSLVLVKGSEKEAIKVREATQLLINFTCEKLANEILVNMQLEISPQHHEVVKGKNSANLLYIMERTKTKIIFPDINDMNIKQIKKSQITITGTIDGVYKARQQLIGNLPIALIFDYPESQADKTEIVNLTNKYGVFITFRQKQRQDTMVVVIKGIEKFVGKIYETRREILKLNTDLIKPEIPSTYYSSFDNEYNEQNSIQNLSSFFANYPESPLTPLFPLTPNSYQSPHNLDNKNLNPYQIQKCRVTTTANLCKINPESSSSSSSLLTSADIYRMANSNNNSNNNNLFNMNINNIENDNNNYLNVPPASTSSLLQNLSPRNSSNNTSGYQSFSSSTNSLEQSYLPFNNTTCNNGNISSAITRAHYSPDSTINYDFKGRRMSDGSLVQNISSEINDHRTPSNYDMKHTFDFDMKRVYGYRAMERPPKGEVRVPNSNWIGLGLSQTSPAATSSSSFETTLNDIAAWKCHSGNSGNGISGTNSYHPSPYRLGTTTGIIDSTPTNRRVHLSQHKDIHSLLTSLGLEHYIKTFVLNEIDLEVFSTLTEENLIELGITAFGARKKLLTAIHSLLTEITNSSTLTPNIAQQQFTSPRFSGSAAPGAERRTSNRW